MSTPPCGTRGTSRTSIFARRAFIVAFKGWFAKWMLRRLRLWDLRTASRADHLIANSHFISDRIRRAYGRERRSHLPAVRHRHVFTRDGEGGLLPHCLAHGALQASPISWSTRSLRCPGGGWSWQVTGRNSARSRQRRVRTCEFVGHCEQRLELRSLMQRAKAFVFAAEEDFGIAPVEAQACGTPVIAFGRGGATESIRGLSDPKPTGVFFSEQTVKAIVEAVEVFEGARDRISPEACRENALRFSPARSGPSTKASSHKPGARSRPQDRSSLLRLDHFLASIPRSGTPPRASMRHPNRATRQ